MIRLLTCVVCLSQFIAITPYRSVLKNLPALSGLVRLKTYRIMLIFCLVEEIWDTCNLLWFLGIRSLFCLLKIKYKNKTFVNIDGMGLHNNRRIVIRRFLSRRRHKIMKAWIWRRLIISLRAASHDVTWHSAWHAVLPINRLTCIIIIDRHFLYIFIISLRFSQVRTFKRWLILIKW